MKILLKSVSTIAVAIVWIFSAGCALQRTTFYNKHYCLAGSQSDTLTNPYQYKNPQPARTIPHRFVVQDKSTGREFGVILRGLKVSQEDPDIDKYTDTRIDSSFFHAGDIYLLKSSIENLPNGDIKAITYVLGQSAVGHNLATGESVVTPIWYHLPQFSRLYFGEAMLDETDAECPLYEAMQSAQSHAQHQEEGFWDPGQKWRDTLDRWNKHREKQRQDIEQFYLKEFGIAESLVRGIAKPEDLEPNIDYSTEMNLWKLVHYAQQAGYEAKASRILRDVIPGAKNQRTKALMIHSLLILHQVDVPGLLDDLSNQDDEETQKILAWWQEHKNDPMFATQSNEKQLPTKPSTATE
mgnify:CR=1 FL=1